MIVKIENVGLKDVSVGKRFAIQTNSMFFYTQKERVNGEINK